MTKAESIMKKIIRGIGILLVASTLTSCGLISGSLMWAGIGAGVGAIAGGDAATGAAVGAAIGAGLGLVAEGAGV